MSEHPDNPKFDKTRKKLLKRTIKGLQKQYREVGEMQQAALIRKIASLKRVYRALYVDSKKRAPFLAA